MVAVIASLALACVRVLALLVEFDAGAGYYDIGAIMPVAFTVGAAIAMLICLLFVILLRHDLGGIDVTSDSMAVVFVSALLGFVIIGCSIYDIAEGNVFSGAPGISGTLSVASLILSFPAAAYFLVGVAYRVRSRDAQIMLSVMAILWMFSRIITEYFAGGIEINNPNRSLLLIALSVTLIFLVSEGRFNVGTERRAFYLFTGFASLITLGLYALPNAVLIMLSAYPDVTNVLRDLFVLCLFFYVLVRLCVTSTYIGDDGDYDEEYDEYDEYDKNGDGTYSGKESNAAPENMIGPVYDDNKNDELTLKKPVRRHARRIDAFEEANSETYRAPETPEKTENSPEDEPKNDPADPNDPFTF